MSGDNLSPASRAALTGHEATAPAGAYATTMTLTPTMPYDGRGILRFLADRAIPGIETAAFDSYCRTVRLDRGAALVDLRFDATAVSCTLTVPDVSDVPALTDAVRRFLDLDADVAAIDGTLASDPALAASVAATPGIRVPGSLEPAETLFRALVGQQVSVAAARTALARLVDALGDDTSVDGSPRRVFPPPQRIAEHGRSVLRGPARRIDAIIDVASALAEGRISLYRAQSVDEFSRRLIALDGIGPWTAGYVALRVLGAGDILLTGDLALRTGARNLGLPATPRELAARGAAWAPWRSYAGMHLWRAASDREPRRIR